MTKALSPYLLDLSTYRQVKRCGKGAFSVVYLYEHKTDKTQIALKQVVTDVEAPGTQMMCLRELSILLLLRHPAILPFVGFSLPEGKGKPFCIATAFMKRGNLQELEKYEEEGKRLPAYDGTGKSIIMYGVAAGMAHVHSHLVCHRDLKAENVFLDDNYEPKIADFGLSKVTADRFKMSAVVGTPFYMAPELFDTDIDSTYAIDVYAYGVMLASIVTKGVFKFPGKRMTSLPDLIKAIRDGDRCELPATCPPGIRELIGRCWDGAFAKRPSFAQIVADLDKGDVFFPETDMARYAAYREKVRSWKPHEEEPVEEAAEPTGAFNFD
jgi:serine/threonine protein kinase